MNADTTAPVDRPVIGPVEQCFSVGIGSFPKDSAHFRYFSSFSHLFNNFLIQWLWEEVTGPDIFDLPISLGPCASL